MISTQALGTYLAIDSQSLIAEVSATLQSLGLEHYHHSVSNNSRTMAKFTLPGLSVIGPRGESMQAYLKVHNSSMPGTALTVQLGMFRLICLNGLFGFGTESIQRIVHRTGPLATSKLVGLPDAIAAAIQYIHVMEERSLELDTIKVSNPLEVIASLPLLDASKRLAFNVISKERNRAEDDPTTVWGLYNIVNECDRVASKSPFAHGDRDTNLLDDILCLTQEYESEAA